MAPNYAYNGKTFISRGITDFGWKHFPFGPDNGNQEYHILTSGNFYVFPAANNNTEDMVNVMAKTLALWDTSMPHSITFEEVALSVKQGIFASEKDYPALDHVNAILVKNYAKIFPKLPTTVSSEIYVKAVKQEISVVSAFEAARYLLQSAVDEVQDKW